ncbi:MAG TPA: AI-2E family transporter, partial [Bacteroidetes bacterium]|nr:AI-2E family transporter [Bacteroidota bacterium]
DLKKFSHVALLALLSVAVIWALIEMVVHFRELMILFVLSALLTYLLDPVVTFLETKGLGRTLATLLIFLILGIFVAWGVYILLPKLTGQVNAIGKNLQNGSMKGVFSNWDTFLREKLAFLGSPETVQNIIDKIRTALVQFQEGLFKLALSLFSALSDLAIIPFITFFLIKDGPAMKKALIKAVPNRYFEMSLNLIHKTDRQLGHYIRGQMIDAFLVGVLSIIALYILDINYYFFIGSIAGLANMIPYFGPIVGAVPAIVVSLTQNSSLTPVIWIAVAFTIIQLIDNVLISPIVVARSVEIHPLLVVVVILIGGQLMGILGMLIAVPAASILIVIVKEIIFGFKNYRILG